VSPLPTTPSGATQSTGRRTTNATGGAGDWIRLIVGAALLVIGLLWFLSSELNAVRDQRRRHRIVDEVKVIDSNTLPDLEDGQLVAMSGDTVPLTQLSDPEFQAKTQALHMRRIVEVYQWVPEEGDNTRYVQTWTRSQVDSTGFPPAYQNPPPRSPVPGPWSDTAQKVSLGSFQLSPPLIREVQNYQSWIPAQMTPPRGWHSRGSAYIRSEDPEHPAAGDIRVRFEIVPPGPITVLAAQEESVLVPWQDPWQGPLFRVRLGKVPPHTLFPKPEPSPAVKIWSVRLLALLVQTLGFYWMMTPLVDHLLHLTPKFRPPSGPVPSLISALALSLLVASLVWITRAPGFSLTILVLFLLAGLGTVLQVRGVFFRKI